MLFVSLPPDSFSRSLFSLFKVIIIGRIKFLKIIEYSTPLACFFSELFFFFFAMFDVAGGRVVRVAFPDIFTLIKPLLWKN